MTDQPIHDSLSTGKLNIGPGGIGTGIATGAIEGRRDTEPMGVAGAIAHLEFAYRQFDDEVDRLYARLSPLLMPEELASPNAAGHPDAKRPESEVTMNLHDLAYRIEHSVSRLRAAIGRVDLT